MDQEGAKLETAGSAGGAATQAARLLELLRSHRQFDDDVEIPLRGATAAFQVAQPPKPAAFHDLERLALTDVAALVLHNGGNRSSLVLAVAPEAQTCMNKAIQPQMVRDALYARPPRSPVR